MTVRAGVETRAVRKSVRSGLQQLRAFARRSPVPAVWGVVAVVMTLVGVLAPVVAPDDPFRPNPLARAQEPSGKHWLGTDFIGRDVLSRIVHGTKWSLFVAVTSVLLGTTLGRCGGSPVPFRRHVRPAGRACGRSAVVLSPNTPGAVARLGPRSEYGNGHPVHCRHPGRLWRPDHVRSQALAVKGIQYVEAARGLGSSSSRLMFRHIAPQCIGPYLILITTSLGIAIVLEATLGFLGAGIPPPTPTWQHALGDAASMLIPKWHLVVFPGLAIVHCGPGVQPVRRRPARRA